MLSAASRYKDKYVCRTKIGEGQVIRSSCMTHEHCTLISLLLYLLSHEGGNVRDVSDRGFGLSSHQEGSDETNTSIENHSSPCLRFGGIRLLSSIGELSGGGQATWGAPPCPLDCDRQIAEVHRSSNFSYFPFSNPRTTTLQQCC